MNVYKFKFKFCDMGEEEEFMKIYSELLNCILYVKEHIQEFAQSEMLGLAWVNKMDTIQKPNPLTIQNASKFLNDIMKINSKAI